MEAGLSRYIAMHMREDKLETYRMLKIDFPCVPGRNSSAKTQQAATLPRNVLQAPGDSDHLIVVGAS